MNWLASRLYDPFMRHCEEACLADWRRNLLAKASGEVLEVGAGTGANIEWYPDGIDEVVFVEPADYMRAQLQRRLNESFSGRYRVDERPIEDFDADIEDFDTVVLTLVLCSVDEPMAVLERLRDLLRPGGQLLFLEHVKAHKTGRRRAQKILEPVWKYCAGNCHLTRDSEALIGDAGFEFEAIERDEMDAALPFLRPTIRGVARRQ